MLHVSWVRSRFEGAGCASKVQLRDAAEDEDGVKCKLAAPGTVRTVHGTV